MPWKVVSDGSERVRVSKWMNGDECEDIDSVEPLCEWQSANIWFNCIFIDISTELQNPSQNLHEKGLRLKFYAEMQINFR